MLQLAGEIGDGALINASHPRDFEQAVKYIKKGTERAGRKMEDVDVAAYTSFSVADDRKSAKKSVVPVVAYIVAGSPSVVLERHGISTMKADQIRQGLAERNWGEAFGSVDDDMIDAFAICGNPDQCIEKIDELFKTGITHFITGSPLGPNKKKSINLFGHEVMPHFKEA